MKVESLSHCDLRDIAQNCHILPTSICLIFPAFQVPGFQHTFSITSGNYPSDFVRYTWIPRLLVLVVCWSSCNLESEEGWSDRRLLDNTERDLGQTGHNRMNCCRFKGHSYRSTGSWSGFPPAAIEETFDAYPLWLVSISEALFWPG